MKLLKDMITLKRELEMKRQEKMDPAQRDAYQTLLKELENVGEEAD